MPLLVHAHSGACIGKIGTRNVNRTKKVLNVPIRVTSSVGLIRGGFGASATSSGAVQSEKVIASLLRGPLQIRVTFWILAGCIRKNAVFIDIGKFLSAFFAQCGSDQARACRRRRRCALRRRSALRRRCRLRRRRRLTVLRTRHFRTLACRRRRCSLRLLDCGKHRQNRTEVHLRRRTNQIQGFLGRSTGNRHRNIARTQRRDLRLRHTGCVNTLANDVDRLGDIAFSNLSVALSRRNWGQNELRSTLQVQSQGRSVGSTLVRQFSDDKRGCPENKNKDESKECAPWMTLLSFHDGLPLGPLGDYFVSVGFSCESKPRIGSSSGSSCVSSWLSDSLPWKGSSSATSRTAR